MTMRSSSLLSEDRFLHTLQVVSKEGKHLLYSWQRLYAQSINKEWVQSLEHNPERAEQMEAFVSRYGQMQDTIADKLLSRWLLALAETPLVKSRHSTEQSVLVLLKVRKSG